MGSKGPYNTNMTNTSILILYYSRHGSTRKLAELIAQGVESVAG